MTNNEWILCSERLPQGAGIPVLVTAKNKFDQTDMFLAFMGYGDGKWHSTDTTRKIPPWEVIAWMPLPESYNGKVRKPKQPKQPKMKAFKVWNDKDLDAGDLVVFAKTASKAKFVALNEFMNAEYISLRAVRLPAIDKLFAGGSIADWYEPKMRLALVKNAGFQCASEDVDSDECENCIAKEYCETYKTMKGENDESAN